MTRTLAERLAKMTKSRFAGLALVAPAALLLLGTDVVRNPKAQAFSPFDLPKPQLPIPPTSGEVGYVLTSVAAAFRPGDEQCPGGLTNTLKQNYLETQTPAERERLLLKVNEVEFEKKWKSYAIGPNGTNICSNAETFDQTGRKAAKLLQSKIAPGMDLDGDSTGSGGGDTCAHENFVGESGEQGVDNQAYRGLGCTLYYRNVDGKQGELITYLNTKLADGEHTMVMRLRDVQSFVNDDSVDVLFASSDEIPITDTSMHILTNVSFTVTANPRWRNVLHGRIVNGVLITDPTDIKLGQEWGQGGARGQKTEYDVRKGRLRLAFQPDGSLDGLMGGYEPIRTLMQSTILGGVGAAVVGNSDCVATYMALQKVADGLKDPKTGHCTAASSAHRIHAVPAYVFDRARSGKSVAAK